MNVDYRDKSKAVTAEDLIRRYNLDGLSKDRKAIKTLNDGLTKQDTIIEEYVRNTTKYVTNQVDNFVTTWFFSGTPTLENKPFIDFSEDEKSSHVEDVYYDKETGYIYQLRLNNDVYSWELIDDDNLRNSLAIANSSADASDNKRNLYYSTPYPPYQVGDVWYSDGLIKRCRSTRSSGNMNELDWVFQSEYSDSSAIMDTTAVVNQFKEYAEKNYVTNSTLETTKESIYGYVGAETTVINDQILQMKTTDEITDDYKLEIFNASEAEVLKLRICGEMSLLYPSDYLYPSDDLYPLDSYLIIENTQGEKSKYPLAINYLNYLNEMVFDEYILENGKQKIIRRVGIDDNSQLVALEEPITENYEDLDVILNEGYNKVYLESFPDKNIKYEMYYIIKTNYTQAIATKVITESEILQKANEINLEVSKKVDESKIISAINLTSETAKISAAKLATIKADNIELEGLVTANSNFKILTDGSMETKNGSFNGNITSNNATITGGSLTVGDKFKVTSDGTLTASDGTFSGKLIGDSGTVGGFVINSTSFSKDINGIYDYSTFDLQFLRYVLLKYVNLSKDSTTKEILDSYDDGTLNSADLQRIRQITLGQVENTKQVSGKISINSNNPKNCLIVTDNSNNIVASIGLGGVNSNEITAQNIVCTDSTSNATSSGNYVVIDGIDGNINASGTIKAQVITQTSLEEKKKNIEKFNNALNEIKKIDIYKYNLINESDTEKKHVGFVIGEKYNYSELVTNSSNSEVDLYSMISLCVQAVKEQQEIIEKLEKRIKNLENHN